VRGFAIVFALLALFVSAPAQRVVVGSKKFTESYVLGEVALRILRDAGLTVEHRQGMGATAIVWQALRGGDIAAYPEYTGTISEEILREPGLPLEEIRARLRPMGIGVTEELGFNNTYALVMLRRRAQELNILRISDLRSHPDLAVGVTHEFLGRADGWKPLAQHYRLPHTDLRGIEHALGYVALQSGQIDLKDAYSTDAEIEKYDLRVLEDDRNYFPAYKAVFLYRLDAPEEAIRALRSLEGRIDEGFMIRMNARATETSDYAAAAALFFDQSRPPEPRYAERLWGWTRRHLYLVGISMMYAILVGVPLGIFAARRGFFGNAILGGTGVIQTIPSLALLALLVPIPLFGISLKTAIVALFLYALLPIVRNTAVGLQSIPGPLRESAAALGLEPWARLFKVYMPMASRTILAGIKTSAVITVGTATLAALIGAGGYGEPIISGLSLNDMSLVLQGAIPAALLALVVQFAFEALDRLAIPKGMRIGD
jgi:osmoprotectant transport system permease protein